MTPKEYVEWFYRKFIDCYAGSTGEFKRDQIELITLIEKHNIKSVLEIGTWEGMTGLLIWMHDNIEKLTCIDIHDGMIVPYGHPSHQKQDKDFIGRYLKNTQANINFIDTMKWDAEEWKKDAGHFDMIFIDGNHDYEHVKNDTEKALLLKPKIIVWHDADHCDDTPGGIDQVPKYLKEFKGHIDEIKSKRVAYHICE